MSSERQLQSSTSRPQQAQSDMDVSTRLRQVLGVSRRDLLTMEQVAADYHFPSAEAARKFVHRHHVPCSKRGRRVLVDRRDFDTAMRRMA